MWSIYRIFKRQIFEPNLIRLPEMNNIRELIERSRRGIKFVGSVWGELEVFESLTFKSPLSTDIKIDADDNKILEAAKKIIIDYIATEEFANKLKEILK